MKPQFSHVNDMVGIAGAEPKNALVVKGVNVTRGTVLLVALAWSNAHVLFPHIGQGALGV